MPTIKDVAAAAGVKPATVSYVLNGTGAVGAATRTRVLAAVQTLGYEPSHTARSLQRRATRTLGLVVDAARDGVGWGMVVGGMVDVAALAGYDVLVSQATLARPAEAVVAMLLRERRVDAVAVLSPVAVSLEATALPVVVADAPGDKPSVSVAHDAGLLEAVGHLLVQGRERIALITPPLEWTLAEAQDQGFRRALDETGLFFDPSLVVEGGVTARDGYEAANELLNRPDPPDAIIAGAAALCFGVLHAAWEVGLVVGRELAVLSCDEPRSADHLAPPLTALRQPYRATGEQLAHLLLQQLRGEPVEDVVLVPQLIVRRSCGE